MTYKKQVTVASLLDELAEARALALRIEQPAAAISATQTAAKLVGLWVDRKEQGNPGDFAGLNDDAAILAKVRAELGDKAAEALASMLAGLDGAEPAKPAPLALPSPDAYPRATHDVMTSDAEER